VNRSITALVLAGALALGGTLVATPAHAAPDEGTYYSVPFSDALFTTVEDVEGYSFFLQLATFDEWAADGFPKPVPSQVAYRKYTWSSTVYGDVQTDAAGASFALTYEQWRSAGSPQPTDDRVAVGGKVIRYAYSDEVFVSQSTYRDDRPVDHKLIFAEFAHLGYPQPVVYDYTFRRLSWLPSIVGPNPGTGEDERLDFATWDLYGRPTPQIVGSFDGDRFCQAAGSIDIRYVGIAAPEGVRLSFGQWRAAGSPAPARC
jgi:hypothetical protein